MRLEWLSTRQAAATIITYDAPSLTRYQVLTGLCPFHHLGPYAVIIAVQKGEHPRRPPHVESLGFSDRLWELVLQCWDGSPSARPTAQELLHCLQDPSYTWAPPLEYPISDGLDEEVGPGFTFGGGWSVVTSVVSFFALGGVVLCFLLLPSN